MNDALLRQLDPADTPADATARTADGLSERALADLERIVAEPRDTAAPTTSLSARRTRPRVVVGLAAAASLAVAGVLAPSALGGGDQAFASWTPVPAGLGAAQVDAAGQSCRDQLAEADAAAADAEVVLAERRGEWTTAVLGGPDGFSGLCITDASTGWFRHDMIGSVGAATGLPDPGARDVVATDLGTGTLGAGDVSLAAGLVGTDVVRVSLRSATHGTVEATVAGGRFALWAPGDDLEGLASVPVRVEYADGTTATVALSL